MIWEEGWDIDSGPYLFNAIPHGYLPLPVGTMFGRNAGSELANKILGFLGDLLGRPTSDLRIGTATVLHRIPFLRHLVSFMGAIPASPGAIKAYLRKGWNVAIVTDGIAGTPSPFFMLTVKECFILGRRTKPSSIKPAGGLPRWLSLRVSTSYSSLTYLCFRYSSSSHVHVWPHSYVPHSQRSSRYFRVGLS